MALAHSPRIVTDGLVLALDAGNTKSYPGIGTAWTDLSGNGNNGTLTNGPTFDSSNLGSLSFDGVDDYVNYGNDSSLDATTGITVSYWMKSSFDTSYSILIDKRPNYSFWIDGGKNLDYYTTGPTITAASSVSTIPTNEWFNTTVTLSGSTLTWYINYENQYTTTASLGSTTSNSLYIGTVQGFPVFGKGNISQVSIYNRALTASEIQQNYNALRGRFGI